MTTVKVVMSHRAVMVEEKVVTVVARKRIAINHRTVMVTVSREVWTSMIGMEPRICPSQRSVS